MELSIVQAVRLHHILQEAEKSILEETGLQVAVEVKRTYTSLSIAAIAAQVCLQLNIPMQLLLSGSRQCEVKEARHLIMYLCRKYIKGITPGAIGRQLGRDRTTVLHAWSVIEDRIYCRDEQVLRKLALAETEIADMIHPVGQG
ncbi:hypothetical protein KTO58_02920 [Chitinophaga pendula]|uniref:helix-turn-helix domain-containing protein n=1 Tax=Chitinophaga TaxID=79328 RepID=UPI0018E010A7|nr:MULTISPECIES: helix-turn-helix domain-containing protein [Chitinophaga]UCJ08150.1 hypothetical protein KTO58_02920 [Chitinophaga pendula]